MLNDTKTRYEIQRRLNPKKYGEFDWTRPYIFTEGESLKQILKTLKNYKSRMVKHFSEDEYEFRLVRIIEQILE